MGVGGGRSKDNIGLTLSGPHSFFESPLIHIRGLCQQVHTNALFGKFFFMCRLLSSFHSLRCISFVNLGAPSVRIRYFLQIWIEAGRVSDKKEIRSTKYHPACIHFSSSLHGDQ